MESIGLKRLFGRGKTPDQIILEVEVVSKISTKDFKVKDCSIKNNLVDLEVYTNKKQALKFLEEGNKIRILAAEFRKQEQRLIVTEKTKIFLLSLPKVPTYYYYLSTFYVLNSTFEFSIWELFW